MDTRTTTHECQVSKVGFAGLVLICVFAAESAGQRRFKETEYVPTAGFRRTIGELRLERHSFLQGGDAAAARQAALQGRKHVPVLCLDYKDKRAPLTTARLDAALFGVRTLPSGEMARTMTQYFLDNSGQRFDLRGSVHGWFELTGPDSDYEGSDAKLGKLLKETLTLADASIDFSQFDNDGPDGIPNSGDDDGYVDAVILVHPEEESSRTNGNHISHAWQYSASALGHGTAFVTNDVRRDLLNRVIRDPATGDPERVMIEDYALLPALASSTGTPEVSPVGVYCHEFAHILGLPDLYDRYQQFTGIGYFGAMSYGLDGADGSQPDRPVLLSAWSRQYLGWSQPELVTSSRTILLEPYEDDGRTYRLDVPGTGRKEYFLIAYRDPRWTAPTRVNWNSGWGGAGLAIWHVDETVGAGADWPFAPKGKGQNDCPSDPDDTSCHALIALEQADLKLELERSRYPSVSSVGDLWRTRAQVWGPSKKAGAWSYAGKDTKYRIRKIDLARRSADFHVPGSPPAPPAVSMFDRPGLSIESLDALLDVQNASAESLDASCVTALCSASDELIRNLTSLDHRARLLEMRRARLGSESPESAKLLTALRAEFGAAAIPEGAGLILGLDRVGVRLLDGVAIPASDLERAIERIAGLSLTDGWGVARWRRNGRRWRGECTWKGEVVLNASVEAWVDDRGRATEIRVDERSAALAPDDTDYLDDDVARESAAFAMGVDVARLVPRGKGLFLLADRRQARRAHRFEMSAGRGLRPYVIHLDDRSGVVLDIR